MALRRNCFAHSTISSGSFLRFEPGGRVAVRSAVAFATDSLRSMVQQPAVCNSYHVTKLSDNHCFHGFHCILMFFFFNKEVTCCESRPSALRARGAETLAAADSAIRKDSFARVPRGWSCMSDQKVSAHPLRKVQGVRGQRSELC